MIPALALAFGLAAAAAPEAPRAASDARALYAAGQFEAAAAAFEARWDRDRQPVDGLNAAVSWRAAGRYGRARALLSRVRGSAGASPDLESRMALVAGKLDELTATVALEGEAIPEGAVVLLDGRPAERDGASLVSEVGRHEIAIEREGCDRFAWSGELRPGVRTAVRVAFRCEQLPGSVHVRLLRGVGRTLTLDGRTYPIPVQDATVVAAPGVHELSVAIDRWSVDRRDVTVASRERTDVEVIVPWRVQEPAFFVGAAGVGYGGPDGGAGTGIVVGAGSGALQISGLFGKSSPVRSGGGAASLIQIDMSFLTALFPPLASGRAGVVPWSVHVEPLAMSIAVRTDAASTDASESYIGLLPLSAYADLPLDLRAEARVWAIMLRQPGKGRVHFAPPSVELVLAWRAFTF